MADETFRKLIGQKKYQAALDYAEENMPSSERDAANWVEIGNANEKAGRTEKALACFLVSWRLKADNYHALLGAARSYNKLGRAENAAEMARKALNIKFTAEASWEYARSCISLGKPGEAKNALEKVLESDSSNVIAARELSNIYFKEGAWSRAVPVLKLTFKKNRSGELAFQIGKGYTEMGVTDSAIRYLKMAQATGGPVLPARMMLGRAYYKKKNYSGCAEQMRQVPSDSMSAVDLYCYGFSLEKTHGAADAAPYYRQAVERSAENDKSDEILLAREKVARIFLAEGKFNDALEQLHIINKTDPKGTIVPAGYFIQAEAYQGRKDIKAAIASLEKAIAVNSRNVEAYARLADLYQVAGKSEKARKTFELMMGLSPNDPKIYLALGNYNLKGGKYSEALKQFEKSIGLRKSGEAFEGIALSAYGSRKSDRAFDAARAALKMNGNLQGARLVLGKVYIGKKEYGKASEHFEKLLRKDPDNAELLELLAKCYKALGKKEKLAVIDKKIIRMNSKNTMSRTRLAKYYESKNNTPEALKLYRELIQLQPGNLEVLKSLVSLSGKSRLIDDAVSYARKYVVIKKGDAEMHRELGDLYYTQKKMDDALEEYRTALKIDPTIKGFHKRYAEIVISKGRQDEVIQALTGVIKSGNADLSTYMTLGLMYQKKKDFIEAIEMYQKALQVEPSNFEALSSLAACQVENREAGDAIITYEQALMINPDAIEEQKILGDLYFKQGRDSLAFETYLKYLGKDSTDTRIALKVGEWLYSQKRYKEAVRNYSIAKKIMDTKNTYRYAQACFEEKMFSDALAVLLPLKPDKKIRGELQRKIYRLVAQSFESDSEYVAAALAYGDYEALSGVNDPEAAFKHALYLEKKDPLEAGKIYEKNIKKYPSDYRNYLHLALLYSGRKNQLEKAVLLFRRVTVLADSIPDVWFELGKIYRKMGNEDEELNAYKKFSEKFPQHIEANQRIGIILIRKNRYNEGIVFLEIANTQEPGNPETMTALANGYMKTGRKDEAINLLKNAKKKDPENPEVRFQLFNLYQSSGKKEEAQKEIEALVKMKHETSYMLLYAEALYIQGKIREATNTVEDILAVDPENVATLMLKGKLLRSRKEYDEAVEVYKEANYIDPKNAEPVFERAETHFLQSKPQWAESFYKRALRLDPHLGRAELGLAKIARLRRNDAAYHQHLENARRLSPDDEMIIQELKKSGK